MFDFTTRNTDPEAMDDLFVPLDTLGKVYDDINRSNRLLGGNRITLNAVKQMVADYPQESYTVFDVGCGDGEMLRQLVLWARRHKVQLYCTGIDLNEKSLAIARGKSGDFPEIRYVKQDVLHLGAELSCDILLCTLTMHHFSDGQIPIFLRRFVEMAKIGVLINDLQRSRLAYVLFKLFSLIFIRTKIAKGDGTISIKSGFTRKELKAFSRSLPEKRHVIQWKWAFRYLWAIMHKV